MLSSKTRHLNKLNMLPRYCGIYKECILRRKERLTTLTASNQQPYCNTKIIYESIKPIYSIEIYGLLLTQQYSSTKDNPSSTDG